MLKLDLPTAAPSIWQQIKALRKDDICFCAPKFRIQLLQFVEMSKEVGKISTGEIFDPIIFETAREDKLQKIYFMQRTTKASSAIYGWHFYHLAADIISESREWKVSNVWWRTLAEVAEACGMQSGYRWNNKDEPHVYFGGLAKSPSVKSRVAYFGTTAWEGRETYTGAAHEAGLLRVWHLVNAV